MTRATDNNLVLLSGGVDSAVCLALALRRQPGSTQALHVSYGQLAERAELRSAHSLASHFAVECRTVVLSNVRQKSAGAISGRNAFLLGVAMLEASASSRTISMGIHAGTPYADCSVAFVRSFQEVFDLYTGGALQLSTPLLRLPKNEVYEMAIELEIPFELTHSCEANDSPCGGCASCIDRRSWIADTSV